MVAVVTEAFKSMVPVVPEVVKLDTLTVPPRVMVPAPAVNVKVSLAPVTVPLKVRVCPVVVKIGETSKVTLLLYTCPLAPEVVIPVVLILVVPVTFKPPKGALPPTVPEKFTPPVALRVKVSVPLVVSLIGAVDEKVMAPAPAFSVALVPRVIAP